MKHHFFTTCGECGKEHPSYSGICDQCAPLYAEPKHACDCRTCTSDLARIVPCEKESK